jgi:hypothetical protein
MARRGRKPYPVGSLARLLIELELKTHITWMDRSAAEILTALDILESQRG